MLVKWLIFDAMGVVFEVGDDVNDLLVPFIHKKSNNISREIINKLYIKASLGKISSLDFWNNLGFTKEYPEIERIFLDNYITIDPEFSEIAKELKEKYSLALLSNDLKDWSKFLRNKFNLNEIFDVAIISGEVGHRKPDKKIYNVLLERIQVPPENCIFIDDKLENLIAASELGIKSIRFIRNASKVGFCSEFEISSFLELKKVLKNFY